ncbi:actin-5c-related [Anaeramoeba flamelloides]|uniref:Actin-5c-related n=1 Tax=Anaeramoeba flamelloides TaxID=1746091 RepID=A0AAV7Y6G5_9EUKA|nr:actin-5c-related [Anaeramoeba flamelloides]
MEELYILDIGAHTTHFGLCGFSRPKYIERTVSGKLLDKNCSSFPLKTKKYIGNSSFSQSNNNVTQIISTDFQSVSINWEELDFFLTQLIEQLGLDQEMNDLNILNVRSSYFTANDDKHFAELMFETLNCEGVSNVLQPLCSVIGCSQISGLCVDIGEMSTRCTPFYEGRILYGQSSTSMVGGFHISKYLQDVLSQDYGIITNGSLMRTEAVIPELKKEYLYAVSPKELIDKINKQNLENTENNSKIEEKIKINTEKNNKLAEEMSNNKKLQKFEIPSFSKKKKKTTKEKEKEKEKEPQTIDVSSLAKNAINPLFSPHLVGKTCKSIHETIQQSVTSCDLTVRQDLLKNVVLMGGSTLTKGFVEKLWFHLKEISPEMSEINFFVPNAEEDRGFFPWLGGSLFGNVYKTSNSLLVSKILYEEDGPNVLNQKTIRSLM